MEYALRSETFRKVNINKIGKKAISLFLILLMVGTIGVFSSVNSFAVPPPKLSSLTRADLEAAREAFKNGKLEVSLPEREQALNRINQFPQRIINAAAPVAFESAAKGAITGAIKGGPAGAAAGAELGFLSGAIVGGGKAAINELRDGGCSIC